MFSLHVGSVLSYAIAVVLPLLDAIIPVVPSETVIIALGVATAGSTDPRIALLVACAAAGAFLGDNLSYFLGHRFGPRVERRFFRGEKGARRGWPGPSARSASLGFNTSSSAGSFPGGRTAVTLCCGMIGYPRRRFIIATAVAAVIWACYAFFLGRIGGRAFQGNPWVGFAVAFGITIVLSGLVEAIRRIRALARHSGVTPDRLRPTTPARIKPIDTSFGVDTASPRKAMPTIAVPVAPIPGPHRVRGAYLRRRAQRHGQQREARQRAGGEADRRPELGYPVAQLQRDREAGLEQASNQNDQPRHRVTSPSPGPPVVLRRRGDRVCRSWRPDEGRHRLRCTPSGCTPSGCTRPAGPRTAQPRCTAGPRAQAPVRPGPALDNAVRRNSLPSGHYFPALRCPLSRPAHQAGNTVREEVTESSPGSHGGSGTSIGWYRTL